MNILTEMRKREGVSIRMLAVRTKQTRGTLERLERFEDRELTMEEVQMYAKALSVPICEFFNEESVTYSERGAVLRAYKYVLSLEAAADSQKTKTLVAGLKTTLEQIMPELKPRNNFDKHKINGWPAVGQRRDFRKELSPLEENVVPISILPEISDFDVPKVW